MSPAPAFAPAAALAPSRARATPHRTPLRPPTCSLASPPLRAPPPPSDPQEQGHDSDAHAALSAIAPSLVGADALHRALSAPSAPLVVVMFHARWCRTCKTLAGKIPRVAAQRPRVAWFQVDFAEMENKPVCSERGVKLLPTFHFYDTSVGDEPRLVGKFTAGPFGIKTLVEKLDALLEVDSL